MIYISESDLASFVSSVVEYLHPFFSLLLMQGITVVDDSIYSSLSDISNFSASPISLSTIMRFILSFCW